MTKTVYLVRHCQTSGQEPDAPLTEQGHRQAVLLAETLADEPIERIVSSPYLRACQTALPLAERRRLTIETDSRLRERVLSGVPLVDWRERLKASFVDLDVCLPGGESSRAAMKRGMAAVADVGEHGAVTTVVVTHGNLLALLLKGFDERAGFAEWRTLSSPDVYRVEYADGAAHVDHVTLV